MRTILAVAIAGALGALARYGLSSWINQRYPNFPVATLLINMTGSFVLGFLFIVLTERTHASPSMRVALTTGFVGAYTTFSTFTYETVRLMEDGAIGSAALNVGASLILGLGAAWFGILVGRAI